MSLKKIFPLLFIFLSMFFISCASIPSGSSSKNKYLKAYKTIELTENLDYLSTNIKYPEFADLPELNKRISNSVLSNWKNFKSYSKSEWNEIAELNNRGNGKLSPFEYLVTYEVSGNNNIISILLNTYIFNGGAHGNTSLITLNYDINTGKYINIQQASDMTFNEISEVCRKQLYKKLIDDDKSGMPPSEIDSIREMINTGAFPQAGNFEIFIVDGIKVYALFEPYSVAPYAYGVQKIQVR